MYFWLLWVFVIYTSNTHQSKNYIKRSSSRKTNHTKWNWAQKDCSDILVTRPKNKSERRRLRLVLNTCMLRAYNSNNLTVFFLGVRIREDTRIHSLTDAGLQALTPLQALQALDLDYCNNISDRGLRCTLRCHSYNKTSFAALCALCTRGNPPKAWGVARYARWAFVGN